MALAQRTRSVRLTAISRFHSFSVRAAIGPGRGGARRDNRSRRPRGRRPPGRTAMRLSRQSQPPHFPSFVPPRPFKTGLRKRQHVAYQGFR